MSQNEESKPADQDNDGIILDLNFAPSWARALPDAHIQRYQNQFNDRDDGGENRHGRRDSGKDRPPRRDFGENDRRKPQDRRSRRDTERGDVRPEMFRPESRGAVADLRVPRHEEVSQQNRREPRAPYREEPQLPIEIRVLPEQKALGAVIRRIQTSHHAFPLRDLAWLFLDNPSSCLIRIEPLKDQQLPLFQCKVCGMPALSEEEVRMHLVNRHMNDFFDVEDVICEPPTGVFVCVARCGLSGELLGPPNHHSYNATVQEMLRTRYPNMTEEGYRARIETVREPDVIEKWRQQCTKKKIYRRKGAVPTTAEPVIEETLIDESAMTVEKAELEAEPKSPSMERDVAELIFKREILPQQIASVKHLICTAAIAMQTTSRPLYFTFKDALSRERRFPASLFFALRGAFRHRKLNLFRVNDPKGPDFVMLNSMELIDPAHAVQNLREILTYVNEHPACTKTEMVTAIAGGDETKKKETLVQLVWLVENGHVIEFYNDVLSSPIAYPKFRLLPGEKLAGAPQQSGSARRVAPAHATTAVPVVKKLTPVASVETAIPLITEEFGVSPLSIEDITQKPALVEEGIVLEQNASTADQK